MKKIILILTTFLMLSMGSFAQNNIQFNIHHKLGAADFSLETGVVNNMNNDFKVTRLEYYISDISLIHDGGIETLFLDLWVLVDASEPTQVDIGDYDISSVEMVKLHIGVVRDYNHLDPSTYDPSHPLAHQTPPMHWGWDPGYRFVAFEGNGGSNFEYEFQIHGLGDVNYLTTEIELSTTAINNEVIINLDADYIRALENIDVNSDVFLHGDYGDAQKCLRNFRDFVFSPSDATTSIVDFSEVSQFEIYPNPAINGMATISLNASNELTYQITVTDILGREVAFFEEINSKANLDLKLDQAGFYFVNLIKNGQVVITKKLISK